MPFDSTIATAENRALLTARAGVVRGEEVWPALRDILGSLDLSRPSFLRVDLREVPRVEMTMTQMLDLANHFMPIRDRLETMRVAFVTGAESTVRRTVTEYVALCTIRKGPQVFQDLDEADAWLAEKD